MLKFDKHFCLLERRRRVRGGRHVVTDQGGRPPMISIRTTRQGDSFPSTTADAATAAALDVWVCFLLHLIVVDNDTLFQGFQQVFFQSR